jgi:hypothetical protein
MRKSFLFVAVGLLLLSLPLFAQDGDKAQILGSPHDMTQWVTDISQTGSSANQVCAFCHIPHAVQGSGAANTPANLPLLWNHQLPSTQVYKPYSSAMLKAGALDGNLAVTATNNTFYSLACLSCHDGSVAIGAVYRMPDNDTLNGTTTLQTGTFAGAGDGAMHLIGLSADLSQTHPINFTYDATLVAADSGLWNATGTNIKQIGSSQLTAVRPVVTPDATTGQILQPILFGGTVQCATCHNPHSEQNLDFLRVPVGSTVTTNKNAVPSLLCLKCHSTQATYN